MPAPADAPLDAASKRRLFFKVFPGVGLAMFGAALDQTLVAATLPAIARDLGGVERLSWVVVAYLVATTVAAPVYGRLGDAFGRRRMLLVALGMYGVGAALCAVAPSVDLLALARVVQGFGGGGLLSLSVALIAEVVPARERGSFQAWIAAVFAVASALGPVVGGVLTELAGWRAVFLLQPPLAVVAAWMAVKRLGDAHPGNRTGFLFDWPGLLLFAAFVVPGLLALDQARRLDPGGLATAAVLALFAGLALGLLWRQERRAADPLLPFDVLGEASIWRANLVSALVTGAFIGSIALLPLYFTAVRGLSTAEAGLALMPLAVSPSFGAMLAGRLLTRTGRTMVWPAIGLTGSAALMVVVALGAGAMPVPVLAVVLAVISMGFGTSFPMVQVTVQVAAPLGRLGSATASVQFTRSLGSATGTALLGALLFGALVAQGGGAPEHFVALVQRGPEALAGLDAAARAAFGARMATAFGATFLLAAALVAGGAWLATRVPLQRV
jgi:EmrB/QacA subfamily drug resistance transporter